MNKPSTKPFASVRRISTGETVSQYGQSLVLDTDAILVNVKGGFTILDDSDIQFAFMYRWNVLPHHKTAYVRYSGKKYFGPKQFERICKRLHRLLLPDANQVDHVNRIGWDNRRTNLRACSRYENARNANKWSTASGSKFKGVTFDKKKRLYYARIHVDGRCISLGRSKSEISAALRYDAAATRYYGEYAVLNIPEKHV